jgi:hypothetical protein
VTKKKSTKPRSGRKPKATQDLSLPPKTEEEAATRRRAAGYLPWNSPEAWAAVEANTRKAASDWHVIATNTPESPAHLTARRRAQILDAVCAGEGRCLRVLANAAAKEMARQGGYAIAHGGQHDSLRANSFDKWHGLVMGYLRPSWAPAETARYAIATADIARHMLSLARSLPEIREMVALHNRKLFPMASLSVPVPAPTLVKIVEALDGARFVTDIEDAAEKMIVRFLIAVGVPAPRAYAVWSYRAKRAKRSP